MATLQDLRSGDNIIYPNETAAAGATTTLTSAAGETGFTLVNDGTGPTLAVKALGEGAGIDLTGTATTITVATQPQPVGQVSSAGNVLIAGVGGTGQTTASAGAVVAGDGIAVQAGGAEIVFNHTGTRWVRVSFVATYAYTVAGTAQLAVFFTPRIGGVPIPGYPPMISRTLAGTAVQDASFTWVFQVAGGAVFDVLCQNDGNQQISVNGTDLAISAV